MTQACAEYYPIIKHTKEASCPICREEGRTPFIFLQLCLPAPHLHRIIVCVIFSLSHVSHWFWLARVVLISTLVPSLERRAPRRKSSSHVAYTRHCEVGSSKDQHPLVSLPEGKRFIYGKTHLILLEITIVRRTLFFSGGKAKVTDSEVYNFSSCMNVYFTRMEKNPVNDSWKDTVSPLARIFPHHTLRNSPRARMNESINHS